MRGLVSRGAAAGAVGTLALDATSYLDILLRGRRPSDLPARAAGQLAERLRLDLGDGEPAANRRSALGALLGYATGVTVGIAYGLVRGRSGRAPWPVDAVVVGAIAMGAGALPLTSLGLTNPREWGAEGWLSDIVPHTAYGIATALAYEAFTGQPRAAGDVDSRRRGQTP
jgi:hypothetical protein